ncbi:MAG: CopG family transcriptional regulator [Saccharolobus sp.]
MKTILVRVTDEEYKELEERAKKEGYVLVTEYVKSLILSSSGTSIQFSQSDIQSQVLSRIEKKVQDMINPFTSQIEELKSKIANLTERIELLEGKLDHTKGSPKEIEKKSQKNYEGKYTTKTEQQQAKKTAIDILREQGVIFESELKLNNPDAFFDKLERQGAIVITTDSERIAIDSNFMEEFKRKISEIHTSDEVEAQKFLSKQDYKLFQKLRQDSLIYFDADTKTWKLLVS